MITIKGIYQKLYKCIKTIQYRNKFKSFGYKSMIFNPLNINGGCNTEIGKNVLIRKGVWLAAVPLTGEKECKLEIQDGCVIGHFNEIFATKSIVIEKKVLTADRVYISDNLHGYKDIEIACNDQPIEQNNTVRIGEGSWLGVGVAVLGAHIGKHCVIGANAVVTHDIPDYSVAVGIPARVIKRYNKITRNWEKTNPDGSFINHKLETLNQDAML